MNYFQTIRSYLPSWTFLPIQTLANFRVITPSQITKNALNLRFIISEFRCTKINWNHWPQIIESWKSHIVSLLSWKTQRYIYDWTSLHQQLPKFDRQWWSRCSLLLYLTSTSVSITIWKHLLRIVFQISKSMTQNRNEIQNYKNLQCSNWHLLSPCNRPFQYFHQQNRNGFFSVSFGMNIACLNNEIISSHFLTAKVIAIIISHIANNRNLKLFFKRFNNQAKVKLEEHPNFEANMQMNVTFE